MTLLMKTAPSTAIEMIRHTPFHTIMMNRHSYSERYSSATPLFSSLVVFPCCKFRRAQAVSRQNACVQPPQLLNNQCQHIIPLRLRHMLSDLAPSLSKRLFFRMCHHCSDNLPQQISIGQAQRVWLCQILFDGAILLR